MVAERRRKVAAMDLRHADQADIAESLGVDPSTVSRDITALRATWRQAAAADVQERIAREDAELDSMEKDVSLEFWKTKEPKWMALRLAIKDRRASLLGLDAPKRTELSGIGGGSINLTLAAAEREQRVLAHIVLALQPFPAEVRLAVADKLAELDDADDS